MPINPKAEDTFRDLADHAMHDRLDDVARVLETAGETYGEVLVLAVRVAAYITVDVSGRYPQEVDMQEVSRIASESITKLPVSKEETFSFLERSVFGFEPVDRVFADKGKVATVPLFTVANLLVSFTPEGSTWSQYLDQIETSIEAAERAESYVLPAMVYEYQAQKKRPA
jgi:hypothetical protein